MNYPDFKKGGFKISGPCKSAARSKFDVYPSAYANAWGVRCTKAGGPGSMGKSKKKKKGGEFPDLTGDGKVTRADILKGRGVIKKRGGKMQFGGSGIDFRTKDEIKADNKAQKKEDRKDKRSERRVGRKVNRYKRVGERRKQGSQGAGEVGLDRYREKLQNKAKRKRKRKARRNKVAGFGKKVIAGVKARAIARRNRRKSDSNKGSGCQGKGCGAYE